MPTLNDITRFLNEITQIGSIADASHNGLQVGKNQDVSKIAFAVDACLTSFRQAVKENAELLVVHHGLSWNASLSYITGVNYERIKFLLDQNLALYAAHLPLDRHPDFGNNVQLFKMLGLQQPRQFGFVNGQAIGLIGKVPKQPLDDFVKFSSQKLASNPSVWNFGKQDIETVAIVSGRGSSFVNEAIAAKADVLLTGEVVHDDYHTAKDGKLNIIAAGHHDTETVGLEALRQAVEAKFGIPTTFIRTETGL